MPELGRSAREMLPSPLGPAKPSAAPSPSAPPATPPPAPPLLVGGSAREGFWALSEGRHPGRT